jgi:hypothetical protein
MELEAKEMRMVILGLSRLLEDAKNQLKDLSDEDDDYVFLANDAMLLDTMIASFNEEYKSKYGNEGSP